MGSEDETTNSFRAKKKWRQIFNRLWVVHRGRSLFIVALTSILILGGSFVGLWIFRHFQCFSREAGIQWKPAPIIDISRPCPKPDYPTVASAEANGDTTEKKPRICLTTLTDSQSHSTWQRLLRCRDFDGVARLTFPNLEAYAKKHGYAMYDASPWIDTSRPPAWSKILAVQKLLTMQEEGTASRCDWVFWIDADIVVMDSDVRIEDFLPATTASEGSSTTTTTIDLLITMDRRLTANSGAWLIRNTEWSKQFLQAWWGMRRWVREPGLSLSGDNAAFGHLMEDRLKQSSLDAQHIRMVPRCTFNSFAVFVPHNASPVLEQEDWYLSENFYHQGDFMAHASGVDQKEACVRMLLAKSK